MGRVNEIFDRIQKTKKEQREIRAMYKDALANSQRFQELSEEIKTLKEKKKDLENGIKADFSREFDKLETLKADLMNDNQLLSDVVISKVAKGEKIELKDQNDTQYEPVFSVRFQKIK